MSKRITFMSFAYQTIVRVNSPVTIRGKTFIFALPKTILRKKRSKQPPDQTTPKP